MKMVAEMTNKFDSVKWLKGAAESQMVLEGDIAMRTSSIGSRER